MDLCRSQIWIMDLSLSIITYLNKGKNAINKSLEKMQL